MASLTVGAEYDEAIEREWARIASPGSFFTGAERVALATEARRARRGIDARTGDVSDAASEAARLISTAAHAATGAWVEGLVERGLDLYAYVEVIGLVARLSSVDAFDFGVGRPERPLPEPVEGEPSGEIDPKAAMNGAWVPTVGKPDAPVALTAIPADHHAMHDLHAAFFLSNDEIFTFDITKDLIRPQLEIVAARVSMLNECFY